MGGGGKGGAAAQVQYEPIKTAEEAKEGASSSTVRAQEMRRGITSTFNRRSMGSSAGGSATGGMATKLGA